MNFKNCKNRNTFLKLVKQILLLDGENIETIYQSVSCLIMAHPRNTTNNNVLL